MSAATGGVLGVAVVLAVGDWWAVARDRRRLEYVLKPATLVALIGVAVLMDADSGVVQTWFVIALSFSLAGDVLLMLPRDAFRAGLVAFLIAHVAYTVGINVDGGGAVALAVATAIVAAAAVPLGARIIAGLRSRGEVALVGPVSAYMVVISAMVASALAAGEAWAAAGAVLFYASDALIGWTRFVGPVPSGRLAIMVTYHLGQTGLVLSLA